MIGKLAAVNHTVLYRPVHGEAASPPVMSWDFFQSLAELLRGHQW
jgi:hypothetical protein